MLGQACQGDRRNLRHDLLMPGAQYRIRTRVKGMLEAPWPGTAEELLLFISSMIDKEIERDAEFEFTKKLNPDPVTQQTKELKT